MSEESNDQTFFILHAENPFSSTFGNYLVDSIEAPDVATARANTGIDHSEILDVLDLEQAHALMRGNYYQLPDNQFVTSGRWGWNWVTHSLVLIDTDYELDDEVLLAKVNQEGPYEGEINFVLNFPDIAVLLTQLHMELDLLK
ncbi:hypothetical protein LUCX_223 [Xanthomonas phage vB_XciM_LucasX]|nr:hypothetical protein LUCX_223 [Xanthomonas phage vB_XciM_LucasX]